MVQDYIPLLDKIKKELEKRNETEALLKLLKDFSDYYPTIMGKVPADKFDNMMLEFIRKEAKKLKITI